VSKDVRCRLLKSPLKQLLTVSSDGYLPRYQRKNTTLTMASTRSCWRTSQAASS
jgi:hypothetical protein